MNEFPAMLLLPFVGGIISFLSPCVLPLVPAYLSFVSGLSAEEVLVRGARRKGQTERMVMSLLLFIMGFSIIFVLMGASASLVGGFLLEQKALLSRVSGVLIILMGLFFMGLLRIPWLNMEKRPFLTNNPESPTGAMSIILVGMAFGFGWTPCIGPILSSILLYASATSTVGLGMALLSAYAVGLGIPFLISGLVLNRAMGAFGWMKGNYQWITLAGGFLMIVMGSLLLLNQVSYISRFFQQFFQDIGLGFLSTI